MRIAVKVGPSLQENKGSLNDLVNGFVHNILGPDNKWHDSFSPYSISTLHGGKLNKDTGLFSFPKGGKFVISSDNQEFLTDIFTGLASVTDGKIGTMPFLGFETYSCGASTKFDLVRIENIRLKDSGKEITFKDENYLPKLREHCIKKLIKNGIPEEDALTFKLEPFHPENWKVKYVKMKTGTKSENVTPSSTIMLIVKGSKEARDKMLSLGYGTSTGSGFGFATTKNDNI